MMVDYNINVPSIQPMQQPNMMQAYGQMQQIQANRMMMQDRERAQQESERFRELLRSGVDAATPEGRRALSIAAPTLGPAYSASDIASKKAVLDIDIAKAVKARGLVEDMVNRIPGVLAAEKPEDAYADLVKFADANLGEGQHNLPRQWPGRAALYGIGSKGAAFVEQNKEQILDENGVKFRYDPLTKTKSAISEAGEPAPARPNRFLDVGQGTPAASAAEAPVGTWPVGTARRDDMQRRAVQYGAAEPAQNAMPAAVGAPAPTGNAMGGGQFGGLPAPAQVRSPIQQAKEEARQNELKTYAAQEQIKADIAAKRPPAPMTQAQEAKMRGTISDDRQAALNTITTMDDVAKTVDKMRNLPVGARSSILGMSAHLPALTEEGRAGETALANLRGKVQSMGRAAASLSGKLGNMAVQEWKIVSDSIANLETKNMNDKQLQEQLNLIADQAKGVANRVKDAYQREYTEMFDRYPGRFELTPSAPSGERPPLSSFGR